MTSRHNLGKYACTNSELITCAPLFSARRRYRSDTVQTLTYTLHVQYVQLELHIYSGYSLVRYTHADSSPRSTTTLSSAMKLSFLDLPAELRNQIYVDYFDIRYDFSDGRLRRWSSLPECLNLFLTCRQVFQEASSLFYRSYFPDFEYKANSFDDLRTFTSKIPERYRLNLRASLRLLQPDLSSSLRKVGLDRSLPWKNGPKLRCGTLKMRLRGDCFILDRHSASTYDRISMYGHLGRLLWHENRIVYRPRQIQE